LTTEKKIQLKNNFFQAQPDFSAIFTPWHLIFAKSLLFWMVKRE